MSTPSSGRRKTGMRRLGKTSEGAARANAVSGDGNVVGGWEEIPEAFGFRVGSIWQGREQMLLADPEPQNPFGYVSEVMAVNGAGTMAVGYGAGVEQQGLVQVDAARMAWSTSAATSATSATRTTTGKRASRSRPARIARPSRPRSPMTARSSPVHRACCTLGIDDAAIYTRGLGWMLMSEFLASQGVLEMSRWQVLGARVSGDGKVLTGTAFPLAADYYQGYRLELDQVFVCHDKHRGGQTLRVGFPDAMDAHLGHGDVIGLVPGRRAALTEMGPRLRGDDTVSSSPRTKSRRPASHGDFLRSQAGTHRCPHLGKSSRPPCGSPH